MLQLLLDRFSAEPGWLMASASIMLMMLTLVLWSFFRHARQLLWFSGAGLVTAGVYVLANQGFLMIWGKWNETFLTTPFVSTFFYQFAFEFLRYLLLYSMLALIVTWVLLFWSCLTLRWQRARIILRRSLADSWLVMLFAFSNVTLLFFVSAEPVAASEAIMFEKLTQVFQMMSFIYCLQLFLRLIDTAYLKTSKMFMEFAFATGLGMLLLKFLVEWGMIFYDLSINVSIDVDDQAIFSQQIFSFFLGLMLIGYLAYFLVQGLFASTYFVEVSQRRSSRLFRAISRLLLAGREPSYSQQYILLGVIVSLFVGSLFLLLGFQGWSLGLIPGFFLGYFILFSLLDHQEDERVRGNLVERRTESGVIKTFS